MTRKHVLWGCGAVAGAALLLWWINAKHVQARQTPDWGDPEQPPVGVAAQPGTPVPLTPPPMASWAAVRPGTPHMTLGSRIRRTYPSTLVDDPESLVR